MIYNKKELIPNAELGFYSCNNLFFNSKIEACIYGTANKIPVVWHFNDDVFGKFPWHIEPTENIDSLYFSRAKQLREKYDYIILAFSGGSDSNNVLESFIKQGLHIDEIITNKVENFNKVSEDNKQNIENWNEPNEFKFQTINRLQYVKDNSPSTKITILDLSEYVFKFFKEQKDESWLNFTKERLNVSGLLRHNFLYFNEVRKQFDKGKKIAMILGIEKPRSKIDKNGNFVLFFGDQAANIATTQEFLFEYDNAFVENFYWNPECTKMIAKQAHLIKRYIEKTPSLVPIWTPSMLSVDYGRVMRSVHERILRNILYPTTWNDNYWQANKSTLDWYSEIDNWFIDGFKDTKEFSIWKSGLEYVKKNACDYLKSTTDEKNIGLRPFTKEYIVGKMKFYF